MTTITCERCDIRLNARLQFIYSKIIHTHLSPSFYYFPLIYVFKFYSIIFTYYNNHTTVIQMLPYNILVNGSFDFDVTLKVNLNVN